MGANIAGIYGAQIFRQEDRPFYRTGFSINIAVLATGLVIAIVRYADDVIRRRRRSREEVLQAESASDEGQVKGGDEGALAGQPEPLAAKFAGDVKQSPL